MTLRETLRRLPAIFIARMSAMRAPDKNRKTLALPAALAFTPRADALPKPTPANLRKFAETPVARKAINSIKDRVAGMKWRIQAKNGRSLKDLADGEQRIQLLTDNLDTPNNEDSFRSLSEQILEDVIVGGFGAAEIQLSGDPQTASEPVAGGRRQHSHAYRLGRNCRLATLRANDRSCGKRCHHRAE